MRGGVGGGHRVCDQFVLSSLAAGEVTGGGDGHKGKHHQSFGSRRSGDCMRMVIT